MTTKSKIHTEKPIPAPVMAMIGDAPIDVIIHREKTPVGLLTQVTISHSFKNEREVLEFATKHRIPFRRNAGSVTLEIWQ